MPDPRARLRSRFLAIAVTAGLSAVVGMGISSPATAPAGGFSSPLEMHLPGSLFHPRLTGCDSFGPAPSAGIGPPNVTAAGTGAAATADASVLRNNSGFNSTMIVPAASVAANQFVILAVEEPVNATAVVAVGLAETSLPIIGRVAAPVAYLPNGTEVVSQSTGALLTIGGTYTFAALHAHGDWWRLTWNGNPITGGLSWENGTYNLGSATAAGVSCAAGLSITPSFLIALYSNGTGLPTLPSTRVPQAIGIAPMGSSSASYRPTAANALPQLAPSLGIVGIQGSDQNGTFPVGELRIGSAPAVAYPGANVSLWGQYDVRGITSLAVTPTSAGLTPGASQTFSAAAADGAGRPIANATFTWRLTPSTLGSLNATTGATVNLTAGAGPGMGTLWVNGSYNCSQHTARIPIAVSPGPGPTIVAFTASPNEVEVGQSMSFMVQNATWPRPVSYAFTGLPAPCASTDSGLLTCTPTVPGQFTVRVFVNDSLGRSSNATTTLTVVPRLGISSFAATPSSVAPGEPVTLRAATVGGAPPYSFQYSGLPTGCVSANRSNLSCTPSDRGTFVITVRVGDRLGGASLATTNLSVTGTAGPIAHNNSTSNRPGGGTLLGLPASGAYAVIGTLVAIASAGILVGAYRRRRGGNVAASAPSPPASPPTPPS